MIRNVTIIAALLLFVSACSKNSDIAPAKTTTTWERSETGPLTGKEIEQVEAQAAIESIDYTNRRMTVRDHQGDRQTYTVSPQVRRFNELKPGDKIDVRLTRAMAFEVRNPTAVELKNPNIAGIGLEKRPLDLPPGIDAALVTHSIVKVSAINLATNTVTVTLPDGKQLTTVAREPKNLTRVKVGDTVAVTYAEALVVDIKPAA